MGIHALFGAFLFGVAMPRDAEAERSSASRRAGGRRAAVAALLRVQRPAHAVRPDGRPDLGGQTARIMVVATLGKFGGTALAARLTGAAWADASRSEC